MDYNSRRLNPRGPLFHPRDTRVALESWSYLSQCAVTGNKITLPFFVFSLLFSRIEKMYEIYIGQERVVFYYRSEVLRLGINRIIPSVLFSPIKLPRRSMRARDKSVKAERKELHLVF